MSRFYYTANVVKVMTKTKWRAWIKIGEKNVEVETQINTEEFGKATD